jgi:hypothetical protein
MKKQKQNVVLFQLEFFPQSCSKSQIEQNEDQIGIKMIVNN